MLQSHYPSLILVLNVHEARWYAVEEDGLTLNSSLSDEKDTYTDRESFFGMPKRGGKVPGGEPDVKTARDANEQHHNLRKIVEQTADVYRKQKPPYQHLVCAVPEQYKNEIADEFAQALPGVSVRYVYGNYVNEGQQRAQSLFEKAIRVTQE